MLNAGSEAHVRLGRVRDEFAFVGDREAFLRQEVAKLPARLDTTFKGTRGTPFLALQRKGRVRVARTSQWSWRPL